MSRYRTDRLLTLYWFHPILRAFGGKGLSRIPILMYHSISCHPEGNRHSYFELNTAPEVFAQQMAYLKNTGYRVIGLAEAVDLVCGLSKREENRKDRYAVLTFDDGFRDFHERAYPVLRRNEFSATVFLPTGYTQADRRVFEGKECLTWDEVRFLSAAGVQFGSHTVTHDMLVEMEPERIKRELRQSKDEIERETGKDVHYFSYPYRYPEQDRIFLCQFESLLARTGYRAAVSTRIGTVKKGDNIYSLRRIPVNSHDDLLLFRAKLEGGYDWLHRLQYWKKRLRPRA